MKKYIVVVCVLAAMNVFGMEKDLVSQLHNALIQATAQPQYIRGLLSSGANPNAPDSSCNTPLHKAKNPEHIRVLLEFGAQLNTQNLIEYTPLMQHIYLRNHHAAECLIGEGVDLDIQDNSGATALHHAVRVVNESNDNQADCKIVRLLLQCGVHFDAVDTTGERLFNTYTDSKLKKIVVPYIQSALCKALGKNDGSKVLYLAKNYSWIPYMIGEEKMISWAQANCVKDGQPLNSVTVLERCLVHQLCFADVQDSVRMIKAGVAVNAPGYDNLVPLSWAIQCNDKQKVLVLLQAGAIVTQEMIDKAQSDEIRTMLRNAYDQQKK